MGRIRQEATPVNKSNTNSVILEKKERRTVIPNPLACKSPLNPGVNEGANGGPGVKVGTYTYESATSGDIQRDKVTIPDWSGNIPSPTVPDVHNWHGV